MSGYDSSEQERLESSVESRQGRWRRNFQWQAVPHLRTNNRKCSAANSGVLNRRLNEAVAAGREVLSDLEGRQHKWTVESGWGTM